MTERKPDGSGRPPKLVGDRLALPRGPALRNRFMLAPLTNLQSHDDGTLDDAEYNWLVKRAEGGFGLTMTCAAHVQASGKAFRGQLGIWSDDHLPGLTRLAKGIAAAGSVSAVQLHHGGRRAVESGLELVCPWDDAETGARALTTWEVEQLIEDFVLAALRAEEAGFQGVEIHGAHGYILGQFLDAENNHRIDGYGGSFADRCKVLFAIIDGIRERCGSGFQLGLRLSPERFGITIAEARATAERAMLSGKVDYLDMSLWDVFKAPIEPGYEGSRLIDHFADLPRGNCLLGVAGKIMDAATAQACIDAGADFVLIGRGAILHHDFPLRALSNPAFESEPLPVTRDYLRAEGLGEAFIGYLAASRKGFVAD